MLGVASAGPTHLLFLQGQAVGLPREGACSCLALPRVPRTELPAALAGRLTTAMPPHVASDPYSLGDQSIPLRPLRCWGSSPTPGPGPC